MEIIKYFGIKENDSKYWFEKVIEILLAIVHGV
jgi:hypothetical protein